MSIKILAMLPLKSALQSADFGGNFLFLHGLLPKSVYFSLTFLACRKKMYEFVRQTAYCCLKCDITFGNTKAQKEYAPFKVK